MKRLLIFSLISLFTVMAQSDLLADDNTQHPLEGAWLGHEIVESNEKMDQGVVKAFKMIFEGEKISVTSKDGQVAGTVKLDDAKNPKWMDIELTMDGTVMTIQAIYEVRDGVFRLCHPEGENGTRPSSFKASDAVVLATFKRSKVEQDGAGQAPTRAESK